MPRHLKHSLATAVVFLAVLAPYSFAQEVLLDSGAFSGFEARSIGPAVMGGRIAAIDAVGDDRLTIYVGVASGGVWKSVDGGTTFKPIFDKQPTQSIGAVTVDPSNPKTVWVGTGESWMRNSVSVGTGVYRTRDAGDNWELVGLPDSEHIARIIVHPKDSNTVFVCASGHLWDSNPERGVFKTTDGGKTWSKVLFVNDDTGCADLAMDPENPQALYAGMWQFRRTPYSFTSGGPGSGLFKSTDGGATWHPARKGLPEGILGRIGLSVSRSKHTRVYAVVEAKKTALFRSDDAGESWTEMNSSWNIQGRPFYFARIVADPNNPDRIYKPGFDLTVSDDGGKSFASVFQGFFGGGVHGDYHDLWINPRNSDQLLVGTDGGLYASFDRGSHWRFFNNIVAAQFYHVSYDMDQPYNVYGGLQDNGTWMGPSQATGGIANRHWKNIGYGDGFWAFADPTDPDTAYVEYQGARIFRVRKSAQELKQIKPLPRESEPDFRFNWNSPIHMSPNHPGTLYLGGQFLFRSRDRGESWERISPDLTTNDPAKQKQEESGGLTVDNSDAEKYETIFAISESPKDANVIWAGTDDGNVQVTRDGGRTWTNVARNIPTLPPNTWVSGIEASHYDPATAYATFDGHMTGDMETHVYKTADYGKTWKSIASPDLKGYAHVIREDLVKPDLLFLGTEFGLFLTVDGGAHWAEFTGKFPHVAVRDLAIHPRDADLIIGTHGRGIYILDDITPLRQITPQILAQDAALLQPRPAQLRLLTTEQRMDGDAEFIAPNPPEGAPIVYYQKKRHIFGDLRLEVYDSKGELVTTVPASKQRGLNRVEWPLRMKPPKLPTAAGIVEDFYAFLGPRAPEGTYTVKLIKNQQTLATQLRLVPDPRSKSTTEDRTLQYQTAIKLYHMLEQMTYVVDAMVDLRDRAGQRAQALPPPSAARKQLQSLATSLEDFRSTLVAVKEGGQITGEKKLRENLGELYGGVNGYEGRPTQSQLERMTVLGKQLDAATAKLQSMTTQQLQSVNPALQQEKLEPLALMTQEEWSKKR
jgi:photosystem II stability/assembly factor-like uncharacterized protein